jgi:hypothetical protein
MISQPKVVNVIILKIPICRCMLLYSMYTFCENFANIFFQISKQQHRKLCCHKGGCSIMNYYLPVFQNQLLNIMNVHICDSCQLNISMWWIIDFFTAFRKPVCTSHRYWYVAEVILHTLHLVLVEFQPISLEI